MNGEQDGTIVPGPGAAGWPGRLLEVLRRQESLFERLDALSARQGELIRAEETEALLALLAERQAIVREIEAASVELAPYRRRWEELTGTMAEADRAEVRVRVAAIGALASKVAGQDEADRKLMEERRGAIASELAGVTRGRGAIAAYGGSRAGSPGARFQDREA